MLALLKGLPTLVTDVITYLCDGRELVVGLVLAHEMPTRGCPRCLVGLEFLALPHIPRGYGFTG